MTTIPTIGFNVEAIEYGNLTLTVWDIGGQDKIRPLWRHYYSDTQGVIFVVDANDTERFGMAKDELHGLLEQRGPSAPFLFSTAAILFLFLLNRRHELRDATVLIYANKQDLPNAASVSALSEALQLNKIRVKDWYIQACCATTGDGLYEGLDWLQKNITPVSQS